MIQVSAITESKTNPRTHFNEKQLAELTESIIRFGVLQPVLVRPNGSGSYELVAGHRRLRAARNAPLEEIPAIVQDLSDKEVLEVQIVENMQRADLHPLEEAAGYHRLIGEHGYDADSLALKIGKSRSYVYGRIKLGELAEPVKKALWDSEISHSVALLIARIPDAKLQKDALKAVTPRYEGHEPMSYRAASDYIQRTYMLRLSEAPWKLADAELVTEAGPCTTCPLRTGNQSELFSDVNSADVCTSPSCFAKKSASWLQREADTKGYAVLTPSQVKKQFSQYGGGLDYNSEYVDLESACRHDTKNRPYGKLLLADAPVVLALHNNKVFRLIAKSDLNREMKRAGHDTKAPQQSRGSSSRSSTPSASSSAQHAKYQRERELQVLTDKGLVDAIAKSKIAIDVETLRFFVIANLLNSGPMADELEVYGYTGKDSDDELVAWCKKLTSKQLLAVMAGEAFVRFGGFSTDEKALRAAFFKHIGVNPDKVAEQVKAKAKADAAAAKKATKKPAPKAPTTRKVKAAA
jgi:ParB/RepB/Spo0J family partition protein